MDRVEARRRLLDQTTPRKFRANLRAYVDGNRPVLIGSRHAPRAIVVPIPSWTPTWDDKGRRQAVQKARDQVNAALDELADKRLVLIDTAGMSQRDLLDPELGHRTILAIASRWGLPVPQHFSRLFRAAYGCSPREFRRDASRAGGLHASGAVA